MDDTGKDVRTTHWQNSNEVNQVVNFVYFLGYSLGRNSACIPSTKHIGKISTLC